MSAQKITASLTSRFFVKPVFTAVIALSLAFVCPDGVYAEPAGPGPPTIRVSGAGAVSAAPDMATVSLGVTTQEDTAREAIRKNNALIADVLAALSALGIDEDDINTQRFSLRQTFDHSDFMNPRATGYAVSNSVTVTLRGNLEKVGDVIGAGVSAGANISAGVSFGLEDSGELYLAALATAMADAAGKARVIAASLGRTLGGVLSVEETNTFAAPVAGRAPVAEEAGWTARSVAADSLGVPITAGEISVTARVEVVYIVN